MRLGAIDIGSNAVRLLIGEVQEEAGTTSIQKVAFFRIPIRLGTDVFSTQIISQNTADRFVKAMKAFWYLMEVHDVEKHRAVATSAMREAANSEAIVARVQQEANINIEVISGETEADLIVSTFMTKKLDALGHYVYIDVGGGSTEVTLIKAGQRVKSKSFQIGTVRMLQGKVSKKDWVAVREWVTTAMEEESEFTAVGTGGNINKIFKEIGKKPYMSITDDEIERVHLYLGTFTYEERVSQLGLRPDRADVILPAAEIYHNIMRFAGVTEMRVPRVGLSDGVVLRLHQDLSNAK